MTRRWACHMTDQTDVLEHSSDNLGACVTADAQSRVRASCDHCALLSSRFLGSRRSDSASRSARRRFPTYLTVFAVPTPKFTPFGITADGGNLWFAELAVALEEAERLLKELNRGKFHRSRPHFQSYALPRAIGIDPRVQSRCRRSRWRKASCSSW